MASVEQIDLFDVIEEMEKHQAPALIKAPREVKTLQRPVLDLHPQKPAFRLSDVFTWLWNFVSSLFGLGIWVNVYTVSRSFGGREQGGWCYLNYKCVSSKQVCFWEADALRIHLERNFRISYKWGDFFSKKGGQDVIVLIEKRRAASQTRCKPSYEEAHQIISYSFIQ